MALNSLHTNRSERTYRVELINVTTRVLDRVNGVFPHFTTLAPYVSQLLHEGATGIVVLVDEETEVVVARKRVVPRVRRVAR